MQPNDRHITHLTLDPTPRPAIPRTIFLVEDALRTASLPGVERELYVIRQLHLGDIHPGQSSLALSRRIELEWARLRPTAIDYRSPSAPSANIVVFPSHAAMLAAFLTLRLTSASSSLPWFYQRLLPTAIITTPTPHLLPTLLAHTFTSISPKTAPTAPAEFLHACATTMSPTPTLTLAIASTSDEAILAFLNRWLPRATTQITLSNPNTATSSTSPHRNLFTAAIKLLLHSPRLFSATELDTHLTTHPQLLTSTTIPTTTPQQSTTTTPTAVRHQAPTTPPLIPTTATHTTTPPPPSPLTPAANPTPTISTTTTTTLQPTRLAGLYFTLPILHHLNFFTTTALEEQPALLHSILLLAATATGITPEDPLFPPPTELHPAAHDWFFQLRRWPRRHARLLLNWIIRRPAHVQLTRTHIDFYFSLNQADIRLRRLGLDINPGWQPALAKVITYHYDDYHR